MNVSLLHFSLLYEKIVSNSRYFLCLGVQTVQLQPLLIQLIIRLKSAHLEYQYPGPRSVK